MGMSIYVCDFGLDVLDDHVWMFSKNGPRPRWEIWVVSQWTAVRKMIHADASLKGSMLFQHACSGVVTHGSKGGIPFIRRKSFGFSL